MGCAAADQRVGAAATVVLVLRHVAMAVALIPALRRTSPSR